MSGLDSQALTDFVGRTLSRTGPDSSAVTDLRVERMEGVGWYGAYRVRVLLDDGTEHRLFLKDFGTPRGPKEDLPGRRERELQMYEKLLDSSQDGTAGYYGHAWEPSAGRYWLLLEWVDGDPLRYQELPVWGSAAAWLARFQARIVRAGIADQPPSWLRRHSERFFTDTADRAVAALSLRSPQEAHLLRPKLERYQEEVGIVTAGPSTVVHGAFLPMQILVVPRTVGARLCPLDWELASWGSPAYDLGFLCYGFSDTNRSMLLEAYMGEARRVGLRVPANLSECVTMIEMHRTLDALARSVDRGYTQDAVQEYVAILHGLVDRKVDGSAVQ